MTTLKLTKSKIKLCLLLVSVSLLTACETDRRYDTRESICLVLSPCPTYTQAFKNDLADEIERTDTPLQVKTIIDYDMICKKNEIAYGELCE